jgi:hypothetical protein
MHSTGGWGCRRIPRATRTHTKATRESGGKKRDGECARIRKKKRQSACTATSWEPGSETYHCSELHKLWYHGVRKADKGALVSHLRSNGGGGRGDAGGKMASWRARGVCGGVCVRQYTESRWQHARTTHLVAVVGRAKHGDALPVVLHQVPLVLHLVGPDYQGCTRPINHVTKGREGVGVGVAHSHHVTKGREGVGVGVAHRRGSPQRR